MYFHKPVMVNQVLECLDIRSSDIVVDCTLGEGGHSQHFLHKLNGGMLVGIEQDQHVLTRAVQRLGGTHKNFIPIRSNFSRLKEIIRKEIGQKVDRVFFDLGLSMYHIKHSGRGFSFSRDEPLDMRMDLSKNLTAAEVVNTYPPQELVK
ncbi:MAG: 16S rRNA (cytosine(1402)-N(4))-methyltransferase, partial [Spirochaetota bacterium]